MLEIRFHGRGGQGAVTASSLLAVAAGDDSKYSQAFPFFGVERRGAPVMAFCRIDDSPITIHEQIYTPDIVVVLDSTLIEAGVDVTSGLKKGGKIILNDHCKPKSQGDFEVYFVNASKIAREKLGVPIVNTAMLGALLKSASIVRFESLEKAIRERFGGKADANISATKECFDQTQKA